MMSGEDAEIGAIRDPGEESGVAGGTALLAFTDAVLRGTEAEIAATRDALRSELGAEAVVDTGAVIAMFEVMDRIADATGIPIDEGVAHDSRYRIGDQLGMGDFAPEHRSAT